MKYLEKIQTLLPLGYLYLIVLGLLKEGIEYYQLGINILKYSSITDILISPISDVTSNPVLIVMILSFFVFFYLGQLIVIKNSHKNWAKKILGQKRFSQDASKTEIRKAIFPFFMLFFAGELLMMFVGLGFGSGAKLALRIKQNNFTCDYRINFNSGKSADILLINMTSSYFFYVTKDDRNIKIAPVGTINNLELIDNKKLK